SANAANSTNTYKLLWCGPGVALKHVNKGTENCAFWFALGGKQSFTSKKITQDIVKDPHLYTFSFKK
ncbi:unnamed protein product, partial [Musa banksii]